MDADVASWINSARQAHESGACDEARACYQKAAYGFSRLTEEEREALKQEIAQFAQTDPVYVDNLAAFRALLQDNPGVLQSELVKGCIHGSSGYADEAKVREVASYVLYYAETLGDVVRVKSGRSYKLYLPGQQG